MAELIQAALLVSKFRYALDNKWGYIWGAAGITWTEARQQQKVNYMVSKYGANWKNSAEAKNDNYYYSALYGSKWIGHMVADCSGLFVWAYKQYGQSIAHGSNSIYVSGYCSSKGKLAAGKRTDGKELLPGTAVFVYNASKKNYSHIGLYVGNGTVIEASGTQAGVCTSAVTHSKWTNWGELKAVQYDGQPEPTPPEPTPTPEKGTAIVTGKNLALRMGPSTSTTVITRAPTGSTVKITELPADEWVYVTYNGKTGFMMRKYLQEG